MRVGRLPGFPVYKFLIDESRVDSSLEDEDSFTLEIGGSHVSKIHRARDTRRVQCGNKMLTELDFFIVLDGETLAVDLLTRNEVRICADYKNDKRTFVDTENVYAYCDVDTVRVDCSAPVQQTIAANGYRSYLTYTELLTFVYCITFSEGVLTLGEPVEYSLTSTASEHVPLVINSGPLDYVAVKVPSSEAMFLARHICFATALPERTPSGEILVVLNNKPQILETISKIEATVSHLKSLGQIDDADSLTEIRLMTQADGTHCVIEFEFK